MVKCSCCQIDITNKSSYECQRCGRELCEDCVLEGSFCPDCWGDIDDIM